MITSYHRPVTLEEALKLLSQPNTAPLGGGTVLSHGTADSIIAVDLQRLSLDSLRANGNSLEIGATLTLQSLLESSLCPLAIQPALKNEAPLNVRNSATIAGTIVACDGRSALVTCLLALDSKIEQKVFDASKIESRISNLGDFLPLRPRGLITSISLPLNAKLAFEYVARTPSDKPIVCVALARWESGRTRMAVGGFGKSPLLAMDGTASDDLATAARNACHEATDEWGSAEYRMDIAATLAKRCAANLT
jgi:CO/xanthine dehydrogenase FAD-binding subunit